MKVPNCAFCEIDMISGYVEHHWASDGSNVFAFLLDPLAPGHLVVVPETHVVDAKEDRYIAAMVMSVAAKISQRYPRADIVTSVGEKSITQHLHLHVVPRTEGDGLCLP